MILMALNQYEEAAAEFARGLTLGHQSLVGYLLLAYATGDWSGAADVVAQVEPRGEEHPLVKLLRSGDSDAALLWLRTNPAADPANIILHIHTAGFLGDPELALEIGPQRLLQRGAFAQSWMEYLSGMRQLDGFKDVVREYGLLDYWRTTGEWADKCQQVGDDFECQ